MNKSRHLVGTLAVLVGAAVMVLGPTPTSAQDDPTVAPAGQLSGDGRTVVAAGRTLSVSQVAGLSPEGHSVTVTGSGFDENKGIYIALCAIPPANHAPSPCGGGQDRAGDAGVSTWISSNPPSYGEGVATPYGPGGSFNETFTVSSMITDTIDCRIVACAIVTRNDHTRSTDRSQDLFVPVSFAAESSAAPSPTTTPPPAPTTTAATTTTTTPPAPVGTVAADGLSVSDGTRTLGASAVTDLDPSGAEIELTGTGYSDTTGILVALCAVGEGDEVGPCTGGSAGSSAWISSSPPDFGEDLAEPYGDGGSFTVDLTVPAVIDADTDCREVACAVTTRPDDATPDDRSQQLVLPVTFAATAEDTIADDSVEAVQTDGAAQDGEADDSSTVPWIPIAIAVVIVAGVGVALWFGRSSNSTPDAGTTE